MMQQIGLEARLKNAQQLQRDAKASALAIDSLGRAIQTAAAHSIKARGALGAVLQPLTNIGFAIFSIQVAIRTIGDLGESIFGAAAAWEQYEIRFNRMAGSVEGGRKMLEDLIDFAQRTPFTIPQLADAEVQARAFGFANEELIGILQDVGDAAANVGMDKLPRIILALGQMRQAARVNSRDMLQLTEAGIGAWEMLAEALDIPTSKLRKLVEQGLIPANEAIEVLRVGMARRFAGSMDALSRSLTGVLSNLQDFAFNASRTLFKGMTDVLRVQLNQLFVALKDPATLGNLQTFGQNMAQAFLQAFSVGRAIIQTIVSIGQSITTYLRPQISLIASLASALRDNLGTAATVVGGLLALRLIGNIIAVGFAAWDAAKKTYFMAASLNAAGVAMALFGALSGVSAANLLRLGGAVNAIGNVLKTIIAYGSLFAGVFIAWARGATTAGAALGGLRTLLAMSAAGAAATVGTFGLISIALAGLAVAIIQVKTIWEQNWWGIQQIVKSAVDFIGDQLGNLGNMLRNVPVLGGAFGGIFDLVGGIGGAIGDLQKQLTQGFQMPDWEEAALRQQLIQEAIDRDNARRQKVAEERLRAAVRAVDANTDAYKQMRQAARWALEDARDAVDLLRDHVRDLEESIRDAQEQMREFSDPRLIGMQAAEDEIFDLEMQIKRARLEELKASKQLKETSNDFDMLAAQQRELAEGLPVPFQQLMWELDQQRTARSRTVSRAQEESLSEQLQRLKEMKEIERDLTFEPMRRSLRETFETMTGANIERTFDDAMKGLRDAFYQSQRLTGELTVQRVALFDAETSLGNQEDSLQRMERTQALLEESRERTLDTESQILTMVGMTTEELKAQYDLAVAQADQRLAAIKAQREAALAAQDEEKQTALTAIDEIAARHQQLSQPATTTEEQPSILQRILRGLGGLPFPPQFAEGGTTRGGIVSVGERGRELALLPSGTQIIPNREIARIPSGVGAVPVNAPRSTSTVTNNADTFNINQASQPVDVVDAIRRYQTFRRITGGR